MKTCTKCKKPGEFTRNKNTPDGFHKWCKPCLRESKRKSYLKNKSHYNSKSRANYEANKEKYNAINSQWRKNNADKMAEYIQKYRASDKGKQTRNRDNKKRYESGYRKAWNCEKRRQLKQATPKWVDRAEIVRIYRERPDGHHVDHIVPIRGRNVCGLNVPWNLQYLTASENFRKSNKS